jgi:hypothetical protein
MYVIEDITFGYCLNLTFKDKNQYYGLRKMTLCNVQRKFLRITYKNNS